MPRPRRRATPTPGTVWPVGSRFIRPPRGGGGSELPSNQAAPGARRTIRRRRRI
jgi:hypothetical protein